jgi:hypothetical protein
MPEVTKEQQYSGLYGPYASASHYLGDTLHFGHNGQGTVIWSYRDEQGELVYVVVDGNSWPEEVKESEVKS